MYIMDYSNTKHSHVLVLEPKTTINKYPFTLKEIIDFFYRNPGFLINPDITPGFINKTKLVLSNNFIPAKKDLYKGDFTLPLPTHKEIDNKWSLKDFMISCYESDLDNGLSAASMISVTKDALRIDQMKNINVIGQHSLNREEFIDAFLVLKKGQITDLNISIGIFSNKNVEESSKVKPIDIRLKYRVKRTGWEVKNDWTTWGPSYTIKHVSSNLLKEGGNNISKINLKLDRVDNLSVGDCLKITGIEKKKKKKLIINMKRRSNLIGVRNEYFEEDLKEGMLISGDGIYDNTFIGEIDKTKDPIILTLSKPCYKAGHNIKVMYKDYVKDKETYIIEVNKDYIVIKTHYKSELFCEGMDILKILGKKVKIKNFNEILKDTFNEIHNNNKIITKEDLIKEAYDLNPDDAVARDPRVMKYLEKMTGHSGSVIYGVNGHKTKKLNLHENQEYVIEQVGNIIEKAYPNKNIR